MDYLQKQALSFKFAPSTAEFRMMIHEGVVPPRSHDLSYLLGLILSQRPMWEVFRKDFQFLSAYAVEYRYPGETATKEMAREAMGYCSKFREQFDFDTGRSHRE